MFTIGDVQIAAPVFLAPMSGVTDAPARTEADRFGAPAVVTEMVAGEELGISLYQGRLIDALLQQRPAIEVAKPARQR